MAGVVSVVAVVRGPETADVSVRVPHSPHWVHRPTHLPVLHPQAEQVWLVRCFFAAGGMWSLYKFVLTFLSG